ncbi:MAG: hypothetical protein P8N76_29045 [Pirellulaceae bacterium]|nr:hypothetical protein [Pirellulaceae bacterium]
MPRSTSSTNDAADHLMSEESGDIENPFQAPPIRGQTGEYGFRPHRGGQILTIGILSLLCCNLLGIAAWLMANADLQMMDKGAMDSAGRELTVAGKVLGIISLVLCALMIVFQLILVAI